MPPKNSAFYVFIERAFYAMLVGACSLIVTYLRDINISLNNIQDKLGTASEKLSAMDAGMKSLASELSQHQIILDLHEARLDALSSQRKSGG